MWANIGRVLVVLVSIGVIVASVLAVMLSLYVVKVTANDASLLNLENLKLSYSSTIYAIDPQTGKQATTLERYKELNPNEASATWNLSKTNSGYITYPSSYYVEDGSYLRIAQVTLGYTLPKVWLKKFMISNARLYFTANNLATITGYSGYDPEVSAGNDQVVCTPGYDSSTYPRSRSYVIGLNLTF